MSTASRKPLIDFAVWQGALSCIDVYGPSFESKSFKYGIKTSKTCLGFWSIVPFRKYNGPNPSDVIHDHIMTAGGCFVDFTKQSSWKRSERCLLMKAIYKVKQKIEIRNVFFCVKTVCVFSDINYPIHWLIVVVELFDPIMRFCILSVNLGVATGCPSMDCPLRYFHASSARISFYSFAG